MFHTHGKMQINALLLVILHKNHESDITFHEVLDVYWILDTCVSRFNNNCRYIFGSFQQFALPCFFPRLRKK